MAKWTSKYNDRLTRRSRARSSAFYVVTTSPSGRRYDILEGPFDYYSEAERVEKLCRKDGTAGTAIMSLPLQRVTWPGLFGPRHKQNGPLEREPANMPFHQRPSFRAAR